MPSPTLLSGLSQIADAYDAILCDVWGVIHNGREAFPAACAALARYRSERGPVVLISNAPRPSRALYGQLEGVGTPREAWSAFVTSGDATRVGVRVGVRVGATVGAFEPPAPGEIAREPPE